MDLLWIWYIRALTASPPLRKYILSTLDILLKSQSCYGNVRVLTGVPECNAQREPPCLRGNRGNNTMALGCPGKREFPGDQCRKQHTRTLPSLVLNWKETLLWMRCWNSLVKAQSSVGYFFNFAQKSDIVILFVTIYTKKKKRICAPINLLKCTWAYFCCTGTLCDVISYSCSEFFYCLMFNTP